MAEASQDECEATFKFIEEVHNCLPVWHISSVAYKDIKNRQAENGGGSGQTGFCPTSTFSFFSS